MKIVNDYDLPYGIHHDFSGCNDEIEPCVRIKGMGVNVLVSIANAKVLEGNIDSSAASEQEIVGWVKKHTDSLMTEWEHAME